MGGEGSEAGCGLGVNSDVKRERENKNILKIVGYGERERDGGLCYWNFEEGEIIGMGRSGLLESEEEERRELFFFLCQE